MPSRPAVSPSISLALQGGGAHGAFTWGVLDALLEHGPFDIEAISGASAGALNAVALAHGLRVGGRDGARQALAQLWTAVGEQVPFELFTFGAGESLSFSPPARALMQLTHYLSPAQLNPLRLNPLRDLLLRQIDFEALQRASPIKLFIAATRVRSGRLRLFREYELSVDALLASACLPSLHPGVVIDGETYWDGGYSANPALYPLLCECRSADTLLVLLAPLTYADTPHSAAEIHQRTTEMAFNATFLREANLLALTSQRPARWWLPSSPLERRLTRLRWHLIEAEDLLGSLRSETRLIAHRPFLEHLRDQGRERTRQWLERHGPDVGVRSTLNLREMFG